MAKTVFDILRLTAKDNCGECGFPTCMAFAVAVVNAGADLGRCPRVPREELQGEAPSPSEDVETALARELRGRLVGVDLGELVKDLGGELKSGGEAIVMPFLGRRVEIGPQGAFDQEGGELDPRDQVLLYNYLHIHGRSGLSGRWGGLESFPNSISKVSTLRRYSEEPLERSFEGRTRALQEAAEGVGGVGLSPCSADLCVEVPVLPRFPIRIHFWDSDPDDGFPAKVKLLFDENAMEYLDLESMVFAAERLVETMLGR